MLGIGTMVYQLSGGSPKDPKDYYGKKIETAEFNGDAITLVFTDGIKIKITDEGQTCCENRYMTCDDEPKDLEGGSLVSIRINKIEEKGNEYGDPHEIAFLVIETEKTAITFCTHNEHNGYYGGFALSINEE